MTDDIVTRLREFTCQELNCTSDEIADEAADEIQRLRTQIRVLEAEVSRLERLASNG